MSLRQLGALHCLEKNVSETGPWVILFHGYGADAYDLFPLAEVFPVPPSTNFLFPNGYLEVPIGPGWTGKAWWQIDMLELQKAAMEGRPKDYSELTPKGLDKAVEKALAMIKDLREPWSKIILGGFSQGAMLATELYLNAPETPGGLALMSGTTLHQEKWKELAKKRAGEKFFMSHGNQDAVLSIKGSQKLETILTQAGMKGSLLTFNGGHEIPHQVVQKLGQYITEISKSSGGKS